LQRKREHATGHSREPSRHPPAVARVTNHSILWRAWPLRLRATPGEINHHWGGRGVYFEDPDGHLLEIITRPYGSESDLRAES